MKKIVRLFFHFCILLNARVGWSQTTYTTSPSVGNYTACDGGDLNCTTVPNSNNSWTYKDNFFRLKVESIVGNVITIRGYKTRLTTDCGTIRSTFTTGGFVNFRQAVCLSTSGQFNLNSSQINFANGDAYFEVTATMSSTFTSGTTQIYCMMETTGGAHYYAGPVTVTATPPPAIPQIEVQNSAGTIIGNNGSSTWSNNLTFGQGEWLRFRIYNRGNSNLTINSTSVSNTNDFYVYETPSSPISAGGYSDFKIACRAANAGNRCTNVSISSNSSSNSSFTYNLCATVINPCTAPSTPSNFSASDNICGSVSLSWSSSSGTSPITYTIRRNGSYLDQTTSTSYSDNSPLSGSTSYSVEATNSCGTSQRASDNGNQMATPTISFISDFGACIGSNVAIFSPSVSGATSYQWYKDGSPINQTNRILQFSSGVTASDAGRYYLTASNGSCTETSNTATLSLNPSPTATFTASTAAAGQNMNFTLNPTHNATFFAWTLVRKSNNATISTGSNSTFSYNFPYAGDDYKLTLAATNNCATATATMDPIRVDVNGNATLPANLSYNISYVADPVNSATGAYTYNHSILSVQGIRTSLNFSLRYQSDLANINRNVGYGFRHSFDTYMSFENGYWVVNFALGRKEEFAHYSTSNRGVPLYGLIKSSLVQNANGTFTYKSQDETVTYLFASTGLLQSITDAYNNVIAFTYNGALLTRVTAPGGRYIDFTYNASNLIATATDNSGRQAVFTYTNGDLTRLKNTRNGFFNYAYQNHLITDIYDPMNYHFLHNVYDAQNRVTHQDLADGSSYNLAYNTTTAGYKMVTTLTDALNRTRIFYYNNDYLKVKEVDELGGNVTLAYNANKYVNSLTNQNNKTITFDTDANGNITATHLATLNRHTATTFNSKNRPTSILNALNVNLNIGYDANGNPLRIDFPNTGNAQLTYSTTGLPLTGRDVMNRNSAYQYNAYGDLTRITTQTGDITMTYDAIGRLISVTDQLNRTIQIQYDAWGISHALPMRCNNLSV